MKLAASSLPLHVATHNGSPPLRHGADDIVLPVFVDANTYNVTHNKTPLRFVRGGLTLDIAFRPHLPCGKNHLARAAGWRGASALS